MTSRDGDPPWTPRPGSSDDAADGAAEGASGASPYRPPQAPAPGSSPSPPPAPYETAPPPPPGAHPHHNPPIGYAPPTFPPPDGGAALPYNPYGPPPTAGPGAPQPTPGSPYAAVPPTAYAHPYAWAPPPQLPFPGVAWFLLLVFIGFVGQIVVGVIGFVALVALQGGGLQGARPENVMELMPLAAFMAILMASSLTWPVVGIVAARLKRLPWRDTFRWRWPGVLPTGLSVVLGAALVPLALLLENLAARVIARGDNVILQMMSKQPSALAMTLLGITLVVAAPVGEELLFRGLGFRGIERRNGFGTAAVCVSLIFAAVHLNATGFLALFMVSVALCWVTSRTDSLLPAIFLHAAYNGVQFLMLLGSDLTPEAARKAARSTELGLPSWTHIAGLVLAVGSALLLTRVCPRHAVD
ncbi:MAG: type II CAAX endopeptidase family protein [bacterium]